jgi:hypothetical protein
VHVTGQRRVGGAELVIVAAVEDRDEVVLADVAELGIP